MGFGNFLESSSSATDQTQSASGNGKNIRGTKNQVLDSGAVGVSGGSLLQAGAVQVNGKNNSFSPSYNYTTQNTTTVEGLNPASLLDSIANLQAAYAGTVTANNSGGGTPAGVVSPNVTVDTSGLGQSLGQALSSAITSSVGAKTSTNPWWILGGVAAIILLGVGVFIFRKKKP